MRRGQEVRGVRIGLMLAGALFVVSLANVFTAPQAPSALQAPQAPAAPQPSAPQAPQTAAEQQLATINQYCVACHNDRTKTAGLSFQGITAASVGERAEVFEKAVRKMRGRVMPPPGARQPSAAAVDSLVAFLETTLDRLPTQAHLRDKVVLHRLNRKEYTNAVRDLLAVDFDAASVL